MLVMSSMGYILSALTLMESEQGSLIKTCVGNLTCNTEISVVWGEVRTPTFTFVK